ncbi:MAG: PRC-barrel domain-containing protein [Chloroflexota bacterium]|nr:PRC-barrel domain-containing protein [Chloroflexota bacterium]
MDPRLHELFLDSLTGNQVKNQRGEYLAKIAELVIDPDPGHVKNVALSLGEAPNSGSALKLSENGVAKRASAGRTGSGSPNHPCTDRPKPSDNSLVYTCTVRRFR